MSQLITAIPAPVIIAYATKPTVCAGQPTNLNALSTAGVTYLWSNNASGANITVSPTSATTYTVLGTNSFGCVGMATQAIAVNVLPTIGVTTSQPNEMCVGETQMLTATGGVSYQWVAANTGQVMVGNPVNINPTATTVYTVTGTDGNGCANKTTITQNVGECTSLKENALSGLNIYPNPTTGELNIELNNSSEKTVQVMDVTGRIISSSTSSLEVVKVNLSNVSNGVYYVRIQSQTSVEVVKVVKN